MKFINNKEFSCICWRYTYKDYQQQMVGIGTVEILHHQKTNMSAANENCLSGDHHTSYRGPMYKCELDKLSSTYVSTKN